GRPVIVFYFGRPQQFVAVGNDRCQWSLAHRGMTTKTRSPAKFQMSNGAQAAERPNHPQPIPMSATKSCVSAAKGRAPSATCDFDAIGRPLNSPCAKSNCSSEGNLKQMKQKLYLLKFLDRILRRPQVRSQQMDQTNNQFRGLNSQTMDLHHPILRDFPEHREIIRRLKGSDDHFRRMFDEYHRLDDS